MSKYPGLKPFAAKTDVLFLGSSWDAWVKGKTNIFGVNTSMINDAGDPTSLNTTYGYRAPIQSDGTAYPDNWYLLSSTPGNAAEQAAYDDQLKLMAEAGMVRFILWYPPAAQIGVGAATNVSDIMRAGRDRHFASSRKNQVQIAYVIQASWWAYDGNSPGTWLNEAAFTAGLLADIADPVYLKITASGIANRPVIGLFKTASPDWDTTHKDAITTAVTGAGYGSPWYIQMNANATDSNSLSCNAITAYGPSGDIPVGGHVPYSTQITKSLTLDTLGGVNASRCLSLTPVQDGRPRGSATWVDTPIYTELEQQLRDRFAMARAEVQRDPPHMIHMYSVCELDEGGTFFPTRQEILRGVNTPSRGRYLDAITNVRNGTFPSAYDDYYTAWSFHANVGGSLPAGWAITQNLAGANQYAEAQNSTTTNARTWTATTTRFRVYGGKRVGLGHIGISLDGAAATDVDQGTLVGSGYNQLLYDSGTIANASHTLAIARISGTVGFDEVVVTVSR